MKKDKLEAFIKKNRAAFDTHQPPDRIWAELDRKLHPAENKGNSTFYLLRIAASVLILFGLGVGFGMYVSNNQATDSALASSPLYQDYQEAEEFYMQRVNQSWSQIQQYGEHELVQEDLDQLDVIYQELRAELALSKQQDNEKLIEEMIKNYRTRAELLETVLERIESSESSGNNFNELKSDNHEI